MADRPTWQEVLSSVIDREVSALHIACPGRGSNFNRTTFTIDVDPLFRPPGATENLPTVLYAKVVFPGVEWDIPDGWTGLLICCDNEFSSWWAQEQVDSPIRERRNDWGAAVFIPGLLSQTYAHSESLPAGATVLPATDLRLGIWSAAHEVPRGDDWRTAINVWTAALQALLMPAIDITAINNTLSAALLAALSARVKVD